MMFSLVRLLVILHLVSNGISDVTAIECFQCSDVEAGNASKIPLEKMDQNCRTPDNTTLTCNDTKSCFTIFAIYDFENETAREITRGCGEGSLKSLKFETGLMKKYKVEKCSLPKCNVNNVTVLIIDEKFHQEKKLMVQKGQNHTFEDRKNARSGVQCYECASNQPIDHCSNPEANPASIQIKKCTSSGTECGILYYSGNTLNQEVIILRRGCGLDCKDFFRISGAPKGKLPDLIIKELLNATKPYKCLIESCTGNLCNKKLVEFDKIDAEAQKGSTYSVPKYSGGGSGDTADKAGSSSIKIFPKLNILILSFLNLLFLLR